MEQTKLKSDDNVQYKFSHVKNSTVEEFCIFYLSFFLSLPIKSLQQ